VLPHILQISQGTYSSTRVADNRMKERINDEDREQLRARQCLISFVWLWETSRELAQKKVEFHKIMQTAVVVAKY
jgi:hypothetical protein